MAAQRELTKCPLACEYCRIKKAKCSGIHPCGNCIDHNEPCVFPERRKRSKKRKDREHEMDERLARIEVMLRTNASRSTIGDTPSAVFADESSTMPQNPWSESPTAAGASYDGDAAEMVGPQASPPMQDVDAAGLGHSPSSTMSAIFSHTAGFTKDGTIGPGALQSDPEMIAPTSTVPNLGEQAPLHIPVTPPSTAAAEDNCTNMPEDDQSTQPDCASYLSICTHPAVKWVSGQSGMSDFLSSARRLSNTVMRGERLGRVIDPSRAPEPSLEVALEWTTAYFEGCLDSVFEIINRQDFENRLREHFRTDPTSNADSAWYAVRNTVYASGCRLTLSVGSNPQAFTESRTQSWKYFENALSVHTDLLYIRSDITSIRALLLMAFHAEALATPALEYMLLSSATRLAQSRGLYLGTPGSQGLCKKEVIDRQCLWWTLYSYEKHIAYRSGLPSAIDDDYISCGIPTCFQQGTTVKNEFITKTIEIAQLSSSIAKQLSTVKAMKHSPAVMLASVQDLDRRLRLWRESLPPLFRTKPPFKPQNLPPGTPIVHILYLHYSYYALTIAAHGVFCYPWNRPDLQNNKSPVIRNQIHSSTGAVAEAARQIILAIQQVEVTAALPVWLTFYFPLVGLINLFVCVLKNPTGSNVASDLSLMDIVVGHFGYIEFISSSTLQFSFPREIASYARNLVKKAKDESCAPDNSGTVDSCLVPEMYPPIPQPFPSTDISALDPGLGLEDWCTFLPPVPQFDEAFEEPFTADEIHVLQPTPQ